MTDTANAPERIVMLSRAKSWLQKRWFQDNPNEQHIIQLADYHADLDRDYATHCDELVAAAYLDAGWRIEQCLWSDHWYLDGESVDPEDLSRGIIKHTPTNARAALTARDERMRAEGAEAADEEAFARGANWAQEKARVEGRLVIVDSPELATLRADLAEAQAKIARLTEALEFYADDNRTGLPSDGPWGLGSNDFGSRARAALQENANE